jgi:hypothetical protein
MKARRKPKTTHQGKTYMKIIVIRSPKALSPILSKLFGIEIPK